MAPSNKKEQDMVAESGSGSIGLRGDNLGRLVPKRLETASPTTDLTLTGNQDADRLV